MISLDSPVPAVLGSIGATKVKRFTEGLGLRTVGDLLRHAPRRYIPTGELSEVADLEEGQMLTVIGEIVQSTPQQYTDRRTGRTAYRLDTVLGTDGARLRMSFFAKKPGIAQWQARRLHAGRRGLFVGQVGRFRDQWQLTNPTMVLFGVDHELEEAGPPADERGSSGLMSSTEGVPPLYPIYRLTKGLDHWDLQRAVAFALTVLDEVPELLPESVRLAHDLPDARTALDWLHAPADFGQVHAARRRLRFEEALVTQLVLVRRRRELRGLVGRTREGRAGGLLDAFDATLPFTLTDGQLRVGAQIDHDLAQPHPMNRLLQGEVGSGKTLVALRAMLRVVDSGGQAALLAPTEVLAQQHHRSITALLGDLARGGELGAPAEATRVELLTGSMTKGQRTEPLLRLASGEAGLVVGTHALLEDQVMFADLGLVVVDEQHRFGVEQRAALTDKAGQPPHLLVMTATPIPRTVAMTVFGDLETSVLSELPAGRAPIQTTVVDLVGHPSWIERVWARVREEVEKGHQAYVVCPRIERGESEQGERDQLDFDDDGNLVVDRTGDGLATVVDVLADLTEGPLAGLRVRMLHGRMPADDKDATMRAFAAGEIDVLVSTTVIEVGVDVPNATVMVLLDADRFGVSQLHQLRGRIGRGGHPGLCLLVTRVPQIGPAHERLSAVAATTDGFELSRVDLEQRREGDVLGASQSGAFSSLQNLRVLRDEDTIVAARGAAERLLDDDPELTSGPLLAAAVAALEHSRHSEYLEKS
ncbi:ATP-dependent DNA helicase RecG [Nocardioides ferulae]|uniref:ATP-dependent DNA helicase RecG n=1 Tax=Nocardioides ferulae TaxID=2340821 RepID=UPI000EACBE65|nr:ATP-dependent DNA helicase RecG [Nocardioides ferulae]